MAGGHIFISYPILPIGIELIIKSLKRGNKYHDIEPSSELVINKKLSIPLDGYTKDYYLGLAGISKEDFENYKQEIALEKMDEGLKGKGTIDKNYGKRHLFQTETKLKRLAILKKPRHKV